ncbi:MAG: phage tail protein, partial [Alphaproteobacteria bacterium]|nr:phage tail protein [Alphaproteobacteria bacterium]
GWGQNRTTGNLLWYDDFKPTKAKTSAAAGKGAAVGGNKGGQTSWDYQAAVIIALGAGPITSVAKVWDGSTLSSLSLLGLTLFAGSATQTPWGYLTSKHPGATLAYRNIAYVAAGPILLNSSPALPNLGFEITWGINSALPALGADANPKDVIYDILTNPALCPGLPAACIGDLSLYSNYCLALGLVVSPVLTSNTAANTFLNDLLAATNSELVWSGEKLTIVPYGDVEVTGNGYTYAPPNAPLYSLGDDDYWAAEGASSQSTSSSSSEDPVNETIIDVNTTFNSLGVSYADRTNDYNPATVWAEDPASIILEGRRQDSSPKNYSFFCLTSAAQMSANLLLGRQAVRILPAITVGPEFVLLDPMDVIALNDAALGIVEQGFRLRELTYNGDESITISGEETVLGSGSAPLYGSEPGAGFNPDYNLAPGDAVAPVVVDVPLQLSKVLGLESWLATAGGPNWGGCDIYISSDGSTYTYAGTLIGPSRMGVVSADFPAGGDPDVINTLSVDLTESGAQLYSGTAADADQGNTLCWVDGEYLSYETATLTTQYHYNLGTYLRRGQYGSAVGAHAAGTPFVRLDDSIFKLPYTAANIGQTIYIKLCSFNLWFQSTQSLADVVAYEHTIGGPPVSLAVSNGLAAVTGPARTADLAIGGVNTGNIAGYSVSNTAWVSYTPQTFGTTNNVFTQIGQLSVSTDADTYAVLWQVTDTVIRTSSHSPTVTYNFADSVHAGIWGAFATGGSGIPQYQTISGALEKIVGTAYIWASSSDAPCTSNGLTITGVALKR